jgi:mutator protein MutT
MTDHASRVRALVMAGGLGKRMQAAGGDQPKPLMRVRGVPLIERSLYALLRAGLADIVVAVPESLPVVGEWVRGRGALLAETCGGRIETYIEQRPLGTIGCAALVGRDLDVLLVVNADNLTTIDLARLLQDHLRGGADLTVATHSHPVQLPYAELALDGDRIVGYREKPTHRFQISSAVYALGPRAVAAIEAGRRCDAPDLACRLMESGAAVRAWPHQAPWIDVNDLGTLRDAEALLASHDDTYELWHPGPAVEVVGGVLVRGDDVLLERRAATARCYADQWDTPGGHVEAGEAPDAAIVRELEEELGVTPAALRLVARFDDVDSTSRRVFRHHVFAARVDGEVVARHGQHIAWCPRTSIAGMEGVASAVLRSLAVAC